MSGAPAGGRLKPAATGTKADFSLATINIIFLLLLFFLLAGTVAEVHEAEVDPAETTSLPLDRLPRPLLVVRGIDDLLLDGKPLRRAALAATVRTLPGFGTPALHLNVLAPKDLSAETLIAVLSDAAAAGTPTVLVTMRGKRADGR